LYKNKFTPSIFYQELKCLLDIQHNASFWCAIEIGGEKLQNKIKELNICN
jgi:hypothetical protein